MYACKGKGGKYEVVCSPKNAGTLKEADDLVVYQCLTTGEYYVRTRGDFEGRMEWIDCVKDENTETGVFKDAPNDATMYCFDQFYKSWGHGLSVYSWLDGWLRSDFNSVEEITKLTNYYKIQSLIFKKDCV